MSCYGCVGSIIKTLTKSDCKKVNVDFEKQLVYLETNKSQSYIASLINRIGKKATLILI